MIDKYSKIELRGIKREGRQVVQLDLETVYVPLAAKTYQSKEIQLDQVLQQGRHLAIIGGPGSGKTTVLLHLAYILSLAFGSQKPELAKERLGLPIKPPAPQGYPSWDEFKLKANEEEKYEFITRTYAKKHNLRKG